MKYFMILLFMVSIMNIFSQDAPSSDEISYRPPTVAGAFYPDNPVLLKTAIEEYLAKAERLEVAGDIYGIVAPHAGYVYSGWVAAFAYKQVQGLQYDAVIIISPSHTKAFRGSCIFDGDAYVTPLGESMVDKEMAYQISKVNDLVSYGRDGHEWKGSRSEHALEVQIPFIQVALPNTKIIPIVMGSQDNQSSDALFKAITKIIQKSGKKVLIVASSDLSHFHESSVAKKMDSEIVKTFNRYDYFKLGLYCFSRNWEACGGGPIVVAMMVAEKLGANKAQSVKCANSSESPYIKGDKKSVVGYFSGLMYFDESQKELLPELKSEQKEKLLEIAKNTVKKVSSGKDSAHSLKIESKEFFDEYAVFVTLHKNGDLRGCMGHTIAEDNLITAVENSAELACSRDPRFPAVKIEEFNSLEFEITILSRMKRFTDINELEIGKDGVLLRLGNRSGLFLPQVATEQKWDKKSLMENLGRKAGLNKDAWLDPNVELYLFKGEVIH
jgi:hypothetical protein